ncbi:glycosyltransferase family 4 protein [Rhodanobacter glycinis]|uniref:Glycosyltransferase family 4 protein n=1 Tax=Rhodanobacter glycinis TaxID=582702 RepID=A0A502BZQ9_9GAMM|nr:glycosyltransferase family 4 protein [Rhodanobacter glycinis]TPG05990.1 glycosyltransferase family 4 protein [Rhodanobacter glycinis]TPG50554.1 glycosyltransferase family 4 protein [Rhodanobacter glycinis]
MTTASINIAADQVMPTATKPSRGALRGAAVEGLVPAGGQRKIRLLVFTSLYPNAAQPRHGVFVEERLRHLVDSGRIAATVVAPVPWFPFRSPMFGGYSTFAAVPESEERYGIRILHPRYPVIPKLGMNIAPFLMYRALLPVLRKLRTARTDFDLIDAHYFYPDGVAAARLGAALGRPVVVTARGTDVTWIPRYGRCRRQIQRAAESAAAIVTVSQALKDTLATLGVNPGKMTVLRNGVDLERFGPRDRTAIRARLGLQGPVWLTVGNLIELKGVDIAIEALAQVPDNTLLIAGAGPEEHKLRRLVERLGLVARVRFLGEVPQAELCSYYNAADALVLASSREGMPNVVLEAMACGTPVVATPVGGVPELITAPEAGELMRERSPKALVRAWTMLQTRKPDRVATRQFAERLGWHSVIEAQCALYARVLSARAAGARMGSAS